MRGLEKCASVGSVPNASTQTRTTVALSKVLQAVCSVFPMEGTIINLDSSLYRTALCSAGHFVCDSKRRMESTLEAQESYGCWPEQ